MKVIDKIIQNNIEIESEIKDSWELIMLLSRLDNGLSLEMAWLTYPVIARIELRKSYNSITKARENKSFITGLYSRPKWSRTGKSIRETLAIIEWHRDLENKYQKWTKLSVVLRDHEDAKTLYLNSVWYFSENDNVLYNLMAADRINYPTAVNVEVWENQEFSIVKVDGNIFSESIESENSVHIRTLTKKR